MEGYCSFLHELNKTGKEWHLEMGEVQIFTAHRPHHQLRRPIWVIAPICLIIAFLICTFKFRPRSSSTCYVSSKTCKGISVWVPPAPFREYTDEGIASWIVIRHILYAPLVEPKIAFLFLSSGSLPFRDALGRVSSLTVFS